MKAEDWIKVEDRLPESEDYVLIHVKYFSEKYNYWGWRIEEYLYLREYGFDVRMANFSSRNKASITHWMPIVLPKEEE